MFTHKHTQRSQTGNCHTEKGARPYPCCIQGPWVTEKTVTVWETAPPAVRVSAPLVLFQFGPELSDVYM